MQTGVGMWSRLGVLLCAGVLSAGCGDSGGDDGNKNGSNSGQHLEASLQATTSNSVMISFKCSLDYSVDIHATATETEMWVREYLDGSANSAVFANPYQAFLQDDALLSRLVTKKMTEGVVGLPGIYGTSSFVATCGDIELAQ